MSPPVFLCISGSFFWKGARWRTLAAVAPSRLYPGRRKSAKKRVERPHPNPRPTLPLPLLYPSSTPHLPLLYPSSTPRLSIQGLGKGADTVAASESGAPSDSPSAAGAPSGAGGGSCCEHVGDPPTPPPPPLPPAARGPSREEERGLELAGGGAWGSAPSDESATPRWGRVELRRRDSQWDS